MTKTPLVLASLALLLAVPGALADDSSVASGDLDAGDSFSHTFGTEGVFDYHCHPHPWMTGAITILASEGAPKTHTVHILEGDAADRDTWVFEPAEFTIHSGDTVRWVNDGEMVHTIMGGVGGAIGGDHTHDDTHAHATQDAPGVGLVTLLAALATLVILRRV